MSRADDILQALLARRPAPILERRTGLPYGWAIWLRTLPPIAPVFGGNDVARAMAARAPRPRGDEPGTTLGFWQAFGRLWWQGWDPAPADQRGLRWLAAFCSLLLHLGLLLALLWIAHVRWAVPRDSGQSGRVQLQFVGRGSPQEGGGGQGEAAPGTETAAAAGAARRQVPPRGSAASPPRAAAQAAPSSPTAEAETPPADDAPQETAAADAPQPVQVTEVPAPTTDFVLPPPPPVRAAAVVPAPAATQVQVIEREVRPVADAPPAPPRIQPRGIDVPAPSVPAEVREREVAMVPRAEVQVPAVHGREPEPVMRTPEFEVRQAELPAIEVPSPSAVDAGTTGAAASSATAAPARAAPAVPGEAPTTAPAGTRAEASPAVSPGVPGAPPGPAAPRVADRSGGWDSAVRGDDWEASARNRQGDAGAAARPGQGLFDADGRARVPGPGQSGAGVQGRGAPGGDADTWTRDRIAESGTWLKRPPYDYTPTSLDRYWVPNESLLEEWVRKGIKKIEIPIPGTNTRISCVVSLLQFGGGCGLSNPNMNEQPAQARPPPDIPFKKELQEDNGSVR